MPIKMIKLLPLISLFVILGCAKNNFPLIDIASFKNYGNKPLNHTMYLGSDNDFHYFTWSSGKTQGKWRVRKAELKLGCEYRFNQKESFLIKNEDGIYAPYLCKKT